MNGIGYGFRADPATLSFMEETRDAERGTTLYNLLELAGILSSAGEPDISRKMIETYATAADMTLLYPILSTNSPEIFFAGYTAELMDYMERGLCYGDAKLLWVAEANEASTLITWNTCHYQGKTPIQVITPEDYQKGMGG